MWKCNKCGEVLEDTFDSCWNCGTTDDGSLPHFQPDPATVPADPVSVAPLRTDCGDLGIVISALGLVACFFAPWVSSFRGSLSPFTLSTHDSNSYFLWTIPVFALGTIALLKNEPARRRVGTATGVLVLIGILLISHRVNAVGLFGLQWGASLTALFGLALFVFSGARRMTTPIDLVAKKLNSRRADVYSHSGTLTPGVHFKSKEFYAEVEAAIRAKQWPGVQILRVKYAEAGLFSHEREYLRIIRQRHLFDLCAATFGADYFFTLREAEIPAVVDIHAFVALMLTLLISIMLFTKLLGFFFGIVAVVFAVMSAVWFLFNALKMGLTQVDSLLLKLPVIGPVYEAWFRPDTYFQQDTRVVFLRTVSELVKEHIEKATSAKGLQLLKWFEKQPIFEGLYKSSVVKLNREREASPTK